MQTQSETNCAPHQECRKFPPILRASPSGPFDLPANTVALRFRLDMRKPPIHPPSACSAPLLPESSQTSARSLRYRHSPSTAAVADLRTSCLSIPDQHENTDADYREPIADSLLPL